MSRHQEKPHPPRFGWLLLKGLLPQNHRDDILGDLEEQYQDIEERRGMIVADLWFSWQVPFNLFAALSHKIFWGLVYFRDDLRLAWRHIRRNRTQTVVNLTGLLIGLACSLVITLYTVNELTYDRQHPHSERLYRVLNLAKNRMGWSRWATTPPPVYQHLKTDFPQIEEVATVVAPWENADHVLVRVGEDIYFNDRTWFAGPELLDILDMPLLRGSKDVALRDPHTVLLSRSWAEKLFGTIDCVGKTVTLEIDYEDAAPQDEFLVTGVVEDSPVHTHLKGDIWISQSTMEQQVPNLYDEWRINRQRYTYVRLREGVDPAEFEAGLNVIPAVFDRDEPKPDDPPKENYSILKLQPITDIHMGTPCGRNPEPMGNWTYIYVYGSIALLVLLVACMNFVHLAATLSLRRAHEFSVRRAFGALRKHLSGQLLAESLLVTLLSLFGAIVLVQIILPVFNRFSGRELALSGLLHPVVLLILAGLVVIVVLGAGVLPAVVHTLSRPVDLLHSRTGSSKGKLPGQRMFILIQLTVLTFLLICTFFVEKQLTFMKGTSLGFDRDHKVVMKVKSDQPGFHRRYNAVGDAFRACPAVLNASVSSAVPGTQWGGYYLKRQDIADPPDVRGRVFTVDPYFTETYGLELIKGRSFDPNQPDDRNYGYVINESLMKALGYATPDEVIGQQLWAHYHGQVKPVIGVIRDFHYLGMQREINPLLLDMEPSLMSVITVTLPGGRIREGMDELRKVWRDQFPGVPFEYQFLDEIFDAQYRYEEQAGRLLAVVTTVTVLIALMGLVGLVTSIVQQRRAEIGIRKVLGASQFDILRMLSRSFVIIALVSGVIAVPLALWTMHQWLNNFAYRVPLQPWLPLEAVLLVLILTLGMMLVQGYRTSRINPATVIREE